MHRRLGSCEYSMAVNCEYNVHETIISILTFSLKVFGLQMSVAFVTSMYLCISNGLTTRPKGKTIIHAMPTIAYNVVCAYARE